MKELPDKYKEEMKALLEDEYDAYMASMEHPAYHGLRVNTAKISVEEFRQKFPYHLESIPWTHNGFYYDPKDPVTKHPYYYAGLYYIQEPSAMLPGEVMPVSPYDAVLDICAAPGGKSTELGAKLNGTGVLAANDISVSRAQALLKNIERFGIKNAVVTASDPSKLAAHYPHYFNRILIDAPCSGEGMFRKDPSLISAWEKRDSSYYVPIQKSIVESAVKMLKEGGTIVYSTCTFSQAEDEEIVRYALSLDPSLHVTAVPYTDGFVQNAYGTRLFPHRIHGEGHFVSILQKEQYLKNHHQKDRFDLYEADGMRVVFQNGTFRIIGDKKYYVPMIDTEGLRVLRSGTLIGEEKKKRFRYSEAFALSMKSDECEQCISMDLNDPRVNKYLRGETLDVSDYPYHNGWALICVEKYPLGLAKLSNGVFKNMLGRDWIMR